MNAIKAARKLIADEPTGDSAKTLARLVLALESGADFPLESLYALDIKTFDIALKILEEWRIDRYYAGKAKLFDLSYQVDQMSMS
ncbi:MAG: hypothetical protein EOP82_27360 [Variovorax sp.]|nr:MAG: hypothetical protein EOP82_27360 [Variovorax sp.]